jgi:predicted kinase
VSTGDLLLLMEHLVEGINDPYIFKAVFLAGGPGSGKSYIASQMFGGLGVKFSNSDAILEFMAGQAVHWNKAELAKWLDMREYDPEKMLTRERSKDLVSIQKRAWMNGMLGLVIDGTGHDYDHIRKLRDDLERFGYDTSMVFVNTSLEVAVQRNQSRGRKVPDKVVRDSWEAVQSNMGKYQSLFGMESFLVIDNSKSLGRDEEQAVGTQLRKMSMKLLGRPLKNSIGQAITWALRQSGGKVLSDLLPADER